MAKKKRDVNVDIDLDHINWAYNWNPTKKTKTSSAFFHDSQIWNGNSDLIFPYNHKFTEKDDFRPYKLWKNNRIASIVPWLLTMSLINFKDFAEPAAPNQISQELQAPPQQYSSPGFPPVISCNYQFTGDSLVHEKLGLPCEGRGFSSGPNDWMTAGSFQNIGFNTKIKSEREIDVHLNRVNPNSVPANNPGKDNEKMYKPEHMFKPSVGYYPKDEYAGPAMELVYSWKLIDFDFENDEARDQALFDGSYVPENNLPLGLEAWRDRVFVTLPKWKNGIPATLTTVPRHSPTKNPKLKPYPNWEWNNAENCEGFTSVFRIQVDDCMRLWILDSGKVEITNTSVQLCPPAIFIFDLRTDSLIHKYTFPEDHIKEDSLYSNIIVDVRHGFCELAVAYISDVFRFGIVVYDLLTDSSFRMEHHFFYPDPLSARYNLHGLQFQWTDGIFGMALSPLDIDHDRTIFFHPMSSFREFAVSTKVFKDKMTADKYSDKFVPVGKPRAKDYGHSSGSAIDRDGVMFFNMVTRDSVWCWDTRKEYIPQNLGVIGSSNVSLVFPNDIRTDHEINQSVWILSDKLPMYLYGYLKSDEVNFRIFRASVKDAVRNTVCDPNYVVQESEQGYDETCGPDF
ncbi:protein yellow-like isoform X2 [Belonocnema kinseyi]|nr:protein yellow-like isoform X2 [Belonocnema kinseyi]XP_033223829.1 protein yellow-like isoform X2 [Belonocnema kinseyi]